MSRHRHTRPVRGHERTLRALMAAGVCWLSACVEPSEPDIDAHLELELLLPLDRHGEPIPYLPASPGLAQATIVLTADPSAAGVVVDVLASAGALVGLDEPADPRSGTIVLHGDGRGGVDAQFLFAGDAPGIASVLVDAAGRLRSASIAVLGPPQLAPSGALSLPNKSDLQILVHTPPSMQGRECLAHASRVTAATLTTSAGEDLFDTVVGDEAFTGGALSLTLSRTTLLDPIANVVTIECQDVYGQLSTLVVTIEP